MKRRGNHKKGCRMVMLLVLLERRARVYYPGICDNMQTWGYWGHNEGTLRESGARARRISHLSSGMPGKTKFRKLLTSRHLVKGRMEDIIILIDLELLSPYTPVTQVAKGHCKVLFNVRHMMWSESNTGDWAPCILLSSLKALCIW